MKCSFVWDERKAGSNLIKHGVSFETAKDALEDPLLLTVLDDRHAVAERRFLSIGRSTQGVLLTMGHTDEDDVIRIITARKATPQERRAYEQ